MTNRQDEIGLKINDLLIIEDLGIYNKRRYYKVRCKCGNEFSVLRTSLFAKNRPQKSCHDCGNVNRRKYE